MTDHAEEQEMEAEALTAIFDTHFQQIETTKWSIDIYPESTDDPIELERLNHVACKLIIDLPETYPEIIPNLSIDIIKGLVDDHKEQLESLALEEAETNLGTPSIFAITEKLREWLIENNVKGLDDQSMHAQMLRKQLQQQKDKEKAKLAFETQKQQIELTEAEREELEVQKRRAEGTPCTKENFEIWQEKFLQEMEMEKENQKLADEQDATSNKKKDSNKNKEVDKTGRLTGYQHFCNKMDNLEALEAAAENAEADEDEEIEEEAFDEELFDDDVDLDDLDFDDEDDDDDDEEEELDI